MPQHIPTETQATSNKIGIEMFMNTDNSLLTFVVPHLLLPFPLLALFQLLRVHFPWDDKYNKELLIFYLCGSLASIV